MVVVALLVLPGCQDYEWGHWWNWFDPSRPLRTPDQTTNLPIFNEIGLSDQTQELLPNAEMPRPDDLEYAEEDYVVGPTDVLNISILDLFTEGMETVLSRQVGHAGFISLPLLERRVKAAGRTQQELVDAIKDAYSPAILRDPTVSVTVAVPRQNTFSILGAVARPGTYSILRKDFTLLQGLALAGDVTQTKIRTVYVIRPNKKKGAKGEAAAPETGEDRLPELPEVPREAPTRPSRTTGPGTPSEGSGKSLEEQLRELDDAIPGATDTSARPRGGAGRSDERILLSALGLEPTPRASAAGSGSQPPAGGGTPPADLRNATVTYKWVYTDGRWVRVAQPAVPTTQPRRGPAPMKPEAAPEEKDPYGWMQYDMSHLARLIAVDLEKLKAGDPRMNIIIRDNDIVHVPYLTVGEFYVMGEVARPGAYALTGRRVTVKQAVAAAGNLGALSWPNNSILIRRIGRDQEQIQQLKLQDIMAGREPDIFLKPDDTIAVGSYWAAPFLAVWRNAFRMTYGFGFIYDRNYSDTEFEIPFLWPSAAGRRSSH